MVSSFCKLAAELLSIWFILVLYQHTTEPAEIMDNYFFMERKHTMHKHFNLYLYHTAKRA
jgi:hypothetical protein